MVVTVLFILSASATTAPPSGPRPLSLRLHRVWCVGVTVNFSCYRRGNRAQGGGNRASGEARGTHSMFVTVVLTLSASAIAAPPPGPKPLSFRLRIVRLRAWE